MGERLLTVDDGFLNTAPFKAAGWRSDSAHAKRTHSPPIPTAIASEYFQAPRHVGLSLEDGEDDGGMLTGGGADTVGPGMATKRRRRREQMEEDDSSDLSDDSDEEVEQRAAQQIRFAKMPLRQRAGSSPTRPPNTRRPSSGPSPRATRRGSQSALDTVKERTRRDTVTSSEVSSDNELEVSSAVKHKEMARAAARAVRLQAKIQEEPTPGIKRVETQLLPEELEDDSDEGSDISDDYVQSIDSASILDTVDNGLTGSPTRQVVGTPPKNFLRQSTIRKSRLPAIPVALEALPPPRPMSTIRPMSVVQPRSLLSVALKAKQHKPSVPFQKFAHLSGQGTRGSLTIHIYTPFSNAPTKPYEVLIRPRVNDGQGSERPVTVADLIGLSLYRYNEDERDPGLPSDKLDINWWTLRMVEEGGEVDDDFPPFERTKPLASFATANSASGRGGGRLRSNSTAHDDFALVPASEDEYDANKLQTPQEDAEDEEQLIAQETVPHDHRDPEATPRNTPGKDMNSWLPPTRALLNPIITTTYNPNMPFADSPQAPTATHNTNRGQQKLLRVHIMSSDVAPGQMVTVDVTTETYMAEVLDLVCRKRALDKANHVLKLPTSNTVVMLDRPVSSIGNVSDLELHRRRFATDGPLAITGSPSSASPRNMSLGPGETSVLQKKSKAQRGQMLGPHPLAREAMKQEELGNANHKRYTVWRKQPMRIVGMSERVLVIDGEYIHIMPASGGKVLHDGAGKTTTVHFSNVIGCKVPRKHPTNVKVRDQRLLNSILLHTFTRHPRACGRRPSHVYT